MRFVSLALRLCVTASFLAAVGCSASTPEPTETTEATNDELQAEDIFCTIFQCEPAPQSRWVKVGEQDVNSLFDHDSFDVEIGSRFSQIQLRIREGGVNIHDVEIHFRDGSSFSPDFKHTYREDSRTEIASFPSGARRIDWIEIDHSKLLFGTGSVVEFWARR